MCDASLNDSEALNGELPSIVNVMPVVPESGQSIGGQTSSNYTQRPPTIVPNYGRKKKSLLPKSNISRVLLYDNVMQQQMLDIKLNNFKIEKNRTCRIMDLHKKSFIVRQSHKKHLMKSLKLKSDGPTRLPAIGNKNAQSNNIEPSFVPTKRHRSQSLPENNTDALIKEFVQLEENSPQENDTTERISLPEIKGTLLTNIERRQDEGITTSLLVQTQGWSEDDGTTNHNNNDRPSTSSSHGLLETEQWPSGTLETEDTSRKNSTLGDPRFQSLQNSLYRMNLPSEGFAELSPSFQRTYAKIPDYLGLL